MTHIHYSNVFCNDSPMLRVFNDFFFGIAHITPPLVPKVFNPHTVSNCTQHPFPIPIIIWQSLWRCDGRKWEGHLKGDLKCYLKDHLLSETSAQTTACTYSDFFCGNTWSFVSYKKWDLLLYLPICYRMLTHGLMARGFNDFFCGNT